MKKESKYFLAILISGIFIAIMWFYGNYRTYQFLPLNVLDRITGIIFILLVSIGFIIGILAFKKK